MFKDQVVWITGASSGIGEALALQFAAAGAKIILSSRRQAELERVRDLCIEKGTTHDELLVLPLDVTDYDAMPVAAHKAIEAFDRIDMLINNAGISQRDACIDTDMSVYRRLMEVDVLGQIAMTKTVLPLMLKQAGGHIAVTSSVYCAAKHAVMGFFDALRAEVSHKGIRVTTITPGFIRTNISFNALTGDGAEFGELDKDIAGGMDASECARVIMKGFRKGKQEIAVGKGIEMHALWLKRFFPSLVMKLAAKIGTKDLR
jgi:NADP-dependent 3-hydroxy acid dehydrogenase YdfG